jgi:hypothetical protein
MKVEDIKCNKEFTKRFESQFKDNLKAESYKTNSYRDYLGRGAETIYTTPIPKDFKVTKWRNCPQVGMLWLSSSINPNGITSKDDIARTYTIKFEQRCSERIKYAREWGTGTVHHFYGYGRTIDQVMLEFQTYLDNK